MGKESSALRRFAAHIKHRVVSADRHWALSRGLHQLSTLEPGASVSPRMLRNLVHGWGNEAWAAGDSYLQAVIRYVGLTRDTIVECGSGLTTLAAGTLAKRQGRSHVALEHHPEWAERVSRELRAHELDNVQLTVCPLRSYESFAWYELPASAMPERIGMVICDGPPAQTHGGRYGALPVLAPRFAPGCVVLLDDTQRVEEQQIAMRWCAEFGLKLLETSETYYVLGYLTGL